MALPLLDKTWNKDLNVEERTGGVHAGTDRRNVMLTIKNKLIGMAVPWTVIGSSDGVTSNMTGTDTWTDVTKVSFGSSGDPDPTANTSWIVLQQAAINAKFQILIAPTQINSRGGGAALIRMSPTAGFGTANGGTDGGVGNQNVPTATDEIELNPANTGWLDNEVTNFPALQDFILHFWQSSDGECTRIGCYNAVGSPFNCNFIFFEKPKNPIVEWTDPVIASWAAAGGSVLTFARFNDVDIWTRSNDPGGGEMRFYNTCEGSVSAMNPQNLTGINQLSGDYEFYPMGLRSNTAGAQGRHGERFDIWWVPTGMVNGTTVPLTPSPTKEFWVFDDMLLVGDGTDPTLI